MHFKIEREHFGVQFAVTVFFQPILTGGGQTGEQLVQLRQTFRNDQPMFIRFLTAAAQLDHFAVDFVQSGRQLAVPFAQRLFYAINRGFEQLCGIHIPRAIHQIVRFVDEKNEVSALGEKALEAYHRVEQVVVVTDDAVAPVGQVERQLEGTQLLLQGKCLDIRAGEFVGLGQKTVQRRIDAVVIAVRPGTGLRGADAFLQRADLVFGCQRDGFKTQRCAAGCAVNTQTRQRILGGLPCNGFCRQVKNALALFLTQCL